jgi:GNAT superfamily N-acetyltransferase
VVIRRALAADAAIVQRLLVEAAGWVDAPGVTGPADAADGRRPMWEGDELDPATVAAEVAAGQFFLAEVNDTPAGAVRFQAEDPLFWPDIPQHDSAFVHRLVVSRAFKGSGVSTALLEWSVRHARELGKSWLRLDCDDHRSKLKALYERFGFRFHSHRQVGRHYVSRYEYPL